MGTKLFWIFLHYFHGLYRLDFFREKNSFLPNNKWVKYPTHSAHFEFKEPKIQENNEYSDSHIVDFVFANEVDKL